MTFVQPRVKQSERWAGELCVRDDWVVLDTETTGMGEKDQVIEIAICNAQGYLLFDERMLPSVPISEGAFAVHGISVRDLPALQTFRDLRDPIERTIRGRRVMIYNDLFDRQMLFQTAQAFEVKPLDLDTVDVMRQYAEYVGEWSEQYGAYRFQKLPGAGHSARADAIATWKLIRRMGGYRDVPGT